MGRRVQLLVILLAAILVIVSCGTRDSGEEGGPELANGTPTPEITATPAQEPAQGADASNRRLVAQGELLYQQQCAACHGINLEGQPNWRQRNDDGVLPAPPHDASGHTWHHPDQMLFDITKYGTTAFVGEGYKSDMIGFADQLEDEEIWAVLAYIKSRWPKKIQEAQPK